jgi:hypothetical protein
MKKGDWLGSPRLYKIVVLPLILLLLVSVIVSRPARIKRIALTEQCFTSLDSSLELDVYTVPAVDLFIPRFVSGFVLPSIRFLVGLDIISSTLYRGPPVSSL